MFRANPARVPLRSAPRLRPLAGLAMLVACLLAPVELRALATDREQPVAIEADSLSIDDKQGISTYRGNVRVTQGSIEINAETVTVHSPGRELKQVICVGEPARFRQLLDGDEGEVRASAGTIAIYPADDRVVLTEDAHLWRGNNEFSGNRIEYDSAQDIVRASAAASGDQRVKVIIQPQNGAADKRAPAGGTPSP